jgi:hypothetical protein
MSGQLSKEDLVLLMEGRTAFNECGMVVDPTTNRHNAC